MFSRVDRFFKFAKTRVHSVRRLWNVHVSSHEEAIVLKHENSGETLLFPSAWLRDNCQCSSCFNQTLYSRMIPFKEFKGSVLPASVSVSTHYTSLVRNIPHYRFREDGFVYNRSDFDNHCIPFLISPPLLPSYSHDFIVSLYFCSLVYG
jgi:hypothetical protein